MRASMLTAALPSGPARRPILLLTIGSFAIGTGVFVISGVLPAVGGSMHVSLGMAGLLLTIFSGVYAVSAPILAVVTGNHDRRRILLVALAAFCLSNVIAAAAPNFTVMIIARVVAALAAALYTPVAAASAVSLAAPEERGRALAAVIGGMTLANALGVPIGTLIGQAIHWRATFVFVALIGLVALVDLTRSLGQIPAPGVITLRERVTAVRRPGVPTTLLATSLAMCGVFVLYSYLAWFAGATAGIKGSFLSVVYLIFGVVAVFSNLIAGWLIDHIKPYRVAAMSMIGLVVVFSALALLARVGSPGTATAIALCGLVAAWSLIGWQFGPAQQQRLLAAAGPQGSILLSLNVSAVYAGQAVSGLVGGALLTSGPTALALAAAGIEVLAMLVLFVSLRHPATIPTPESRAHEAPVSLLHHV